MIISSNSGKTSKPADTNAPPIEELFGYYPPGYTEPYDFECGEDYDDDYGSYEPEDFDPNEFMTDYNCKFHDAPPIMFRDEIVDMTLSCLLLKYKPNPLLVGVPGCGKTCIAEEIARRLSNYYRPDQKGVPEPLKQYTVWELHLSSLVSGSGLVGEVEKKARNVLLFASNPRNKVILFIDEIHLLSGADKTYDKLAQIFKPALARGNIKVIGATTVQEAQALACDPAFNRRFTRITVDELTPQQTKILLRESVQKQLSKHYCNKVKLSSKIIDALVPMADELHTAGAHRPDNAITLLDMAMADAYLKYTNSDASVSSVTLSVPMLKKAASKLLGGVCAYPDIDGKKLRDALSVIKGQDDVIEKIVDVIRRRGLGLYPLTKPLTLLFAGNSGVGKTETAKLIARELLNTEPLILNMTEYSNEATITRILGSPIGYIGSDSKAELPFDRLEGNPYQVILLDEFEKCDRAVQRLFMSVFDEGRLTTAKGHTIDFTKAIIIASTNAGHTARANSIGFTNEGSAATVSELSASFDTELLNRFSHILNFAPITEKIFAEIIADKYSRQVKEIKSFSRKAEALLLADRLTDKELARLVRENYSPEFGARHINDIVRGYIEDSVMSAFVRCTL